LAWEAIIKRISASDDVPVSLSEFRHEAGGDLFRVAASSVVERRGRRQSDAFVIDIQTLEHFVEFLARIAERACKWAHLIGFITLA